MHDNDGFDLDLVAHLKRDVTSELAKVLVGNEAAIEALGRLNVAVVISDVQLPAMSGIELITRVKGVPVVIVSASTDTGVKSEALRAGATAFFAKPFSPAAVCAMVQELLKESKNV